MNVNDTKLTDEQLQEAYRMYTGVRTYEITKSLKKIINYVYECAVKNEAEKIFNLKDK